MNIAIFTPSQNPFSETFIQAHKKYLKGNIFYYYGGKQTQLEGHPSMASSFQRRSLKLQKRVFRKHSNYIVESIILNSLKENKIDIVLAEYGPQANFLLPFVKKLGLPLVAHFHGFDASVKAVIEKNDNYKALFSYASRIIAVSKRMEQMLLDIGCPREKVVYNVYGPQPEFLTVQPVFSKKQFVAIGRFTDKKAPYYTLMAFKKIIKNHPDAKLIMAGDGALLNTCKNIVRYLNLEGNVEFPGIIKPEVYRELLTESLGFVQHSITAENGDMEGTPLAVLEASAAGLPVISTFHAGIPDVIMDGKTGLLCEEHDVEAMAYNMIKILDDVDYAQKLGRAGKLNIKSNFSLERHIDVLQNILKSAVEKKKI